ncbi:MAG: hypothetical protein Q9220_007102 [cf. Caloplaca sp. 1 TL-2023]
MGPIVRLIGSGVGLAAEAYQRRKSRSRSPNPPTSKKSDHPDEPPPLIDVSPQVPKDPPPPYDGELVEVSDEKARELIAGGNAVPVDERHDGPSGQQLSAYSTEDSDTDDDEREWALDDAALDLEIPVTSSNPSETSKKRGLDAAYTIESLCAATVARCPPISSVATTTPLPLPVILPQRRPGTRERGFIYAYAPILETKSLPQEAFLTFITNLYESTQVSPYLNIISIGANVAGFIPSPIAMATSIVVQVAVGTAIALQRMQRTSTYLDTMNAQVFMPRGLFAMIMRYIPDAEKAVEASTVDTSQLIAKRNAPHNKMNIRPSASGKTYAEIDLPDAAPLIFPALDDALKEGEAEKRNKLKGSMDWVADYYDRRAQATYNAKHTGSKLSVPAESTSGFASSLSDPNHPAFRGSWATLFSGGKIPPKKERRAARAARRGREYDPNRPRGPIGLALEVSGVRGKIRRMKAEVLYLMIVNLPSDAELEDAKRQLREAKEAKEKSKWSFSSKGKGKGEKEESASAPPVNEVEQPLRDTKIQER